MVSSVLVELVADAGEAPSCTKSVDEGVKALPGGHVTTWVGEVAVFGMEVEVWIGVPRWFW